MQEVGETSKEIVEDDEKAVQAILDKNKARTEPYWIVIYAKPSKNTVDGKPAIVKYRKAVYTKPMPQVGMITGEVNNQTGTINWEVNLHDKPFGFELLGLQPEPMKYETTIPQAYIYN